MIKLIIGFVLGVTLSAVLAQDLPSFKTTLASGTNPNGDMSVIHVDADGYVICSDQKKP